MHIAKYLAAALAVAGSGWLLTAANGIRIILLDNAAGWHIYDVPSHPTVLMIVYLVGGFSLPFLSRGSSQLFKSSMGNSAAHSGGVI